MPRPPWNQWQVSTLAQLLPPRPAPLPPDQRLRHYRSLPITLNASWPTSARKGGGDFNPRAQPTELAGALGPKIGHSLPKPSPHTRSPGHHALSRSRHDTLPSQLEALASPPISMPAFYSPKCLRRPPLRPRLHAAVSRNALVAAGGLAPLVDYLADDYELGARVDRAGYRVVLSAEVVETAVPAYRWSGFIDHQLRWYRTVRDARPSGYIGLVFTHGLAWALLNVVASGLSPLSLWLLALSFFLRLTLAMTVGAAVLADHQVLPSLWLLPLRDLVAMGIWIAGFAGNTSSGAASISCSRTESSANRSEERLARQSPTMLSSVPNALRNHHRNRRIHPGPQPPRSSTTTGTRRCAPQPCATASWPPPCCSTFPWSSAAAAMAASSPCATVARTAASR